MRALIHFRRLQSTPWLMMLVAALLALPAIVNAAWYDSNWSYRRPITIQSSMVTGGPHTNFPVLISISSDTHVSSWTRADGFDILFTDDDGVTKLDHEIERYLTGTGELVVWVKIPSLPSASDKDIFLYYGHSTSPDQQSATVWSEGFDAVWHWNDDFLDASGNGEHGTNNGSTDIVGVIADGQDFDGVDDHVDLTVMDPKDYDDLTISTWYKSADASPSDDEYIYMHFTNSTQQIMFGPTDDGGEVLRFAFDWGGTWEPQYGSSDIVDQNWHYLVAVRTSTRIKIYIDGNKETDVADPYAGVTFSASGIGPHAGDNPGDTEQVHGTLDELRIAGVARSDGWVETEFNNQNPDSTFYTMAAEESSYTISGTIFEDVNYGGGTGRNYAAALADAGSFTIERDLVTVELYDSTGAYVASTPTAGDGSYSFSTLSSANYTVRVVNASVTSTRTGSDSSEVCVQTFRIDGASEGVGDGAKKVGGEQPADADAPANSGVQTLADLQAPASQYTQSIVTVDATGGDVTSVDFGLNFDTVVNTKDAGQGSLRQFVLNANLLGDNASLDQANDLIVLPPSFEHSIFMIPPTSDPLGRTADGGYTGSLPDGGTGSAFVINPLTKMPPVSDDNTSLHGGTQTAYSGNSSVSVAEVTTGPEVMLDYQGTVIGPGFDITGDDVHIESLGVGSCNAGGGLTGIGIRFMAAGTILRGVTTWNHDYGGARADGATGFQMLYCVSRDNGQSNKTNDGIQATDAAMDGTFSNNEFIGNNGFGIDINFGCYNMLIENNLVKGNGFGGTVQNGGIAMARSPSGGNSTIRLNTITGTFGAGIVVDVSFTGVHITQNSIYDNGGLGIDLAAGTTTTGDGVTTNDGDDADSGGNDLRNFPVITSAVVAGGTITVDFDLDLGATLAGDYKIELFKNSSGVDVTHGEGETYVDSVIITHGGTGVESFSHSFPGTVNDTLTATTTDSLATGGFGNTSEFSAWSAVTAATYEISGTVFEDADFAGTASEFSGATPDSALPNVDVELYDASDSSYVTSVITTGAGAYSFFALSDGDYFVRVRSATIGDADTAPAGGLNGTVPGTWPYPLAEMTWGDGSAFYGGQNPTLHDEDTGDNAGIGDTHVPVTVSGADEINVNFGFAYNLIVDTEDDGLADNARSDQGSLRQFIKNANAIGTTGSTTANYSEFRMQEPANTGGGTDSLWQITTASTLPVLSDNGTTIDGSTQTAVFDRNTMGPEIEVFGNGIDANGLWITAANCEIRGLTVNGFSPSFRSGILVNGSSATGNTIAGNYVGTNYDGTSPIANYHGVQIATGAQSNTVGGTTQADRNLVSGNVEAGILVTGINTNSNIVRGNYVGTDRLGTAAVPNKGGIRVMSNSQNNIIGGTGPTHRNIVSGNSGTGIEVSNSDGNTVSANFVGTKVDGMSALGNLRGMWLASGAQSNTIGGSTTAERNIISGNFFLGLLIAHTNTSMNVVHGNFIGTDTTGIAPVPNANQGIQLAFSTMNNVIGGTAAGEANTIAFNTGDGIWLQSVDTDGNRFSANSIFSNGALGIDIDPDGIGTGSGANNDKAAPVLVSVVPSGANFTVVATSTTEDTLEFFRADNGATPVVTADASGSGEGFLYLGSCIDNGATSGPHIAAGSDADAAGGSIEITILSSGLSSGDDLTATATGAPDGTSEFAANMQPAVLYAISGTVFEDADFTGTASEFSGATPDSALPNVDVELYDASDSSYVTSVTTTGAGAYNFPSLADGDYFVRVRSATIGDADTAPAGGLNVTVPGTWPYPLVEMTWGNGAAAYGGQNATADDGDVGDNAGIGDTHVPVTVSGADEVNVHFGFAYNLIVNTEDDGRSDNTRSVQGCLRQFIKNANAIGTAGSTTANYSEFYMQVPAVIIDGPNNWWRFEPVAALPGIVDDATVIDGSTQADNSGIDSNLSGPEIEIHGASAGLSNGLFLSGATNVVLRDLGINFFGLHGVSIDAATGASLFGNYIGIRPDRVTTLQNDKSGVIVAASGATIGSTADGEGNLIAYNWERGIHLTAAGVNSEIVGNEIHNNGHNGIRSLATNILIAKNLIRNNSTRELWDEILISGDTEVFNNTIHGSPSDGIAVEGTNVDIRNNIVTGSAAYGINVITGSITDSNNLVTDAVTAPTNGAGQSNITLSASTLNMEPLYVNELGGNLQLTECTSPAINAGLDLGGSQPDMNGITAGLFNGSKPEMGAFETTCLFVPVIVKKAFSETGTPIMGGTTLPTGTLVKYLLYVNNASALLSDANVQDALDAGFSYVVESMTFDNSVPECSLPDCTAAEENTIFSAADGGTTGTDTEDGDAVNYGAGVLNAGSGNASNAQLDLLANKVWAVVFTVRMN